MSLLHLYLSAMSIESRDPRGQPPPRSLYHKERPTTRSRSSAPRPHSPARSTVADRPLSSRSELKPGTAHLLRNVKIFGLFVVGVAAVLMISIFVLRTIWSIKDRELKSSPRPAALTTASNSTDAAVTGAQTTAQLAATATQPTPALDTDKIRRAVFLSKLAQSLEDSGSLNDAISRYREALDTWPYLNAVWGQLGRAYLKAREFNKAQLALEKAVQGSPGTAELMNDLGAAMLYQGKVDRAQDLFLAASDIDPSFAPSFFNLALCRMAKSDRVGARDYLQKFLGLKPRDARALRELAFLDAIESNYEDALSSLERALPNAPTWPLLYFDAAAVSALMGRMDQAITYLQKAEPLSTPSTVYQIFREPAFREIRLTELGKEFEHDLANRARERMNVEVPAEELHPSSEPLFSGDANKPTP